ncbi:C6 transcription factor, putative [Talaromyces stipitatus ATCC 10500]|uniref:C6 transcription factor, putative n=1 Tax=Talaromyces stipitatus (strain ATCC 10500 / CBS 375.48 / QM 6759 / NRRL 1006) TaxID=441959 RepID=B8LTC2_TALSN|nr:C6 transcription factor, putative [Talaromyces stipitatus ATCC 10500]EED22496.1 C6 transcription factor, putative [Talaromyces stipitatus ATCC 10500]
MPLRSNARNPSSLACIPCRQRHLKCDALIPPCSRCKQSNVKCHYVASKRGLRRKDSTTTSPPTTEPVDADASCTSPPYTQTLTPTFSPGISEFLPSLDETSQRLAGLSTPEETRTVVSTESCAVPAYHNIAFDPMIKLYYQNFHSSHPFVIPRKSLSNYDLTRFLPPCLISMMQFIGSHFHPDPTVKDRYQKKAYMSLNDSSEPSGFKVQAMLLAAIAYHAHGNEEQAGYMLNSAITMASQLGIQSGSFAGHSYPGNAILEESWRRTFWELFIVVHLFKTFSAQQNCDIQWSGYRDEDLLKMELPCDEATYYAAGSIPQSKTLPQLQNVWRSVNNDTEETFSSFSYRIEAIRLWEMVQSVNSRSTALMYIDEIELDTLDIRLTTLLIRLMKIYQCFTSSANEPDDQMRRQAQMITLL